MKTSKARPPGNRLSPERIVLGSQPNVSLSKKPTVRIFVGTERSQHRAERILVWSIETNRDPTRIYEIYLMKELRGFDRRHWLTGFTNYRFAIPTFAGISGLAIYNDVDQIYLTDPGELFDRDMKDHGFLTIARNDSSVMLMDCAKMSKVWTLESAQQERKKALLQKALAIESLWGKLEPEWNARDDEFRDGKSKVLHFTALHTQPWHPFPKEFVYQKSPEGNIWTELENQANTAGYHLFSRTHPSSQFIDLVKEFSSKTSAAHPISSLSQGQKIPQELGESISLLKAESLLLCHLVGPSHNLSDNHYPQLAKFPHLVPTPFNLLYQESDTSAAQQFDIVFSGAPLNNIPDEDIPWTLEELFQRAKSCVVIHIQTQDGKPSAHPSIREHQRDFHWWTHHIESISLRYPTIHWKFQFQGNETHNVRQTQVRSGGHWIGSPPRIWILSDGKVGHTSQSERLAKSLGWPFEIKHLKFYSWNKIQKLFWGILPPNIIGLHESRSAPLAPPWPDIVISTGWRPAPIARWISQQNQGKTRTIQIGRKGGFAADLFDVVITPSYYRFPPHPHRVETTAPLNQVTEADLKEKGREWPNLFDQSAHPRMVFIVGGSTRRFTLTKDITQSVAKHLKDLAQKCQGTIFAVTSPRTGKDIVQILEHELIPEYVVHRWQPNQTNNPYLAYLAGADVIILTGESESMLAECASLGKPMYIIPLAEQPPSCTVRLSDWIVRKAYSRPVNKRGTLRPQKGIERFCARLVNTGLIQPRRDLNVLHQALIKQGMARPFGETIENGKRPRLYETDHVAKQVKEILGVFDHGK